jgi:hypothetical protein
MSFETYRPNVRLKAMANGPLRSNNNYQFGFYDIGVMRHALQFSGSPEYRVAALPIPTNDFDLTDLERIISHPSVQYAIVDKNKVVATIIDGQSGWMSTLNKMGFKVKGGGKAAKRMKSFHRATLINAHFDKLNIQWVEPTEYSRYTFNEDEGWSSWVTDPSVKARLLDGAFVVSSRLIQEAVKNLPVYEPFNTLDTNEYYYDPTVRQQLVMFLLNSKVFNARIIFDEGTLKGNIIVSDELPEWVDVISSRENLKKEITYSGGFRLLAEPQGPKSRVITDDQTVINLPKLFRKSDMKMWLEEEYEKMFTKATEGQLITDWKSVFMRNFSRENQDIEDIEAQSRISYVGYRWVSMGLSITNSPWLFETLAVSHAKPLQKRIPIPCSVYEQVIPESMARMAGHHMQVEEGTIMRINEIGVHVVNDFDWLEMYESHGGHDQDDFFKLFYRTIETGEGEGVKSVVVARSPNGFGEYSIFRYVQGQWYPKWTKSDGEEVSFPSVNGRGWPQRLSVAIRDQQVSYTGLPSATREDSTRPSTEEYSVEDVMHDVKIAMNGGNVGRYVNAAMLHSMVITKHRPVQLCSLESAIDGCTQTSDPDDRTAIDSESDIMIEEVLNSNKPIDRDFWFGRFRSLAAKHPEVETYEGKITQLNKLCNEYYNKYVQRVIKYSQENVRPLPIIHELGQRLYYHALPVLRNFRMSIFNANASDIVQTANGIKRNEWEYLYNNIVDKIESFERVQDQYDFILSLYSASIKNPTSNGKITDQIVMNRLVYPYLEAALIHYGIGNKVVMKFENGEVKLTELCAGTWSYPNEDEQLVEFNNVIDYQKYHAQFSPIAHTSPDIPQKNQRRLKAEF